MFFTTWADILRAIIVTATTFILIVAILRVVGSQALARMSGYDMVVTVTLGSIVATVAVTRGISVAEGAAALLTLILLQELVRFLQSRFLFAHHAVRQVPIVLVWEGALLEDRLRESTISADEVRAAVRRHGLASIAHARLVVLENDGEWSVLSMESPPGDDSALVGLPLPGRPGNSPDATGDQAQVASPRRTP